MIRHFPPYLAAVSAAALAACSAGAQTSAEQAIASDAFDPGLSASLQDNVAPLIHEPVEPGTLAPEALAGGPAKPIAISRAADISCRIVRETTSHGVRLTAKVASDAPVSGGYSFIVTQRGSAGSSDITQGGDFKSGGNESVSLSSSEFSVGRGYRAVLTLRVGDREVCRREVKS